MTAVRQLDVDERGAALGERRERLVERRAHARFDAFADDVAGHADANARQRVAGDVSVL